MSRSAAKIEELEKEEKLKLFYSPDRESVSVTSGGGVDWVVRGRSVSRSRGPSPARSLSSSKAPSAVISAAQDPETEIAERESQLVAAQVAQEQAIQTKLTAEEAASLAKIRELEEKIKVTERSSFEEWITQWKIQFDWWQRQLDVYATKFATVSNLITSQQTAYAEMLAKADRILPKDTRYLATFRDRLDLRRYWKVATDELSLVQVQRVLPDMETRLTAWRSTLLPTFSESDGKLASAYESTGHVGDSSPAPQAFQKRLRAILRTRLVKRDRLLTELQGLVRDVVAVVRRGQKLLLDLDAVSDGIRLEKKELGICSSPALRAVTRPGMSVESVFATYHLWMTQAFSKWRPDALLGDRDDEVKTGLLGKEKKTTKTLEMDHDTYIMDVNWNLDPAQADHLPPTPIVVASPKTSGDDGDDDSPSQPQTRPAMFQCRWGRDGRPHWRETRSSLVADMSYWFLQRIGYEQFKSGAETSRASIADWFSTEIKWRHITAVHGFTDSGVILSICFGADFDDIVERGNERTLVLQAVPVRNLRPMSPSTTSGSSTETTSAAIVLETEEKRTREVVTEESKELEVQLNGFRDQMAIQYTKGLGLGIVDASVMSSVRLGTGHGFDIKDNAGRSGTVPLTLTGVLYDRIDFTLGEWLRHPLPDPHGGHDTQMLLLKTIRLLQLESTKGIYYGNFVIDVIGVRLTTGVSEPILPILEDKTALILLDARRIRARSSTAGVPSVPWQDWMSLVRSSYPGHDRGTRPRLAQFHKELVEQFRVMYASLSSEHRGSYIFDLGPSDQEYLSLLLR